MLSIATSAFACSETPSVISETRIQNTFYGIVLASDLNVVLSQGECAVGKGGSGKV